MKVLNAPRQPFVGLALGAITGIVTADYFPLPHLKIMTLLCVFGVCAVLLLWRSNHLATYVFVAAGFYFLHGIQTTDTSGLRLAAWLGEQPRVATATGRVMTEAKLAQNGFATFLFRLNSIQVEDENHPSDATIFVRWRGNPDLGDELKLFGMIEPIAPPRNPGQFDMQAYLARRDVRRGLFVRYAENHVVLGHHGGNPILHAAQSSRKWMQAALCRGLKDSPDVQDFLSGIVLGLRHQTPEDIEEPFQQTGTLHLFAVAGLHVGIVGRLLWVLATIAQLSRRWAASLIIPSLLFYAAVTGLHVSSVRAAIMASILLGGVFFERQVFALNSLAAAAFFLLCWNTNELFATGFQLSFAVVGAIILLADPVSNIAQRWVAPDPFLPRSLLRAPQRIFNWTASGLARGASVSTAAWVGSLVLILWYFYLIAPISLVANLVVVPIAFFILAVALLSLVSATLWPWLSLVFNNANWVLARLVLAIVHSLAQIPGGHIYFAHPHGSDGAQTTMTVLDLGAGGAVHVQTTGRNWLFDCGSERDYERVIREYLHASGINRLEGLCLSHGDAQHIGAAVRIISDAHPALILDNPAPDRSAIHRQLHIFFKESGTAARDTAAGDQIVLSKEMTARVLYPPAGLSTPNADDQALVIQFFMPSARVLFLSDSGQSTENTLLAAHTDLRSDVLVKGKHRSSFAASPAFLQAVKPRLIVATSRDFPISERISDEWAQQVRAAGIRLFRQDEAGAVQFRFRPNDWEARAYVTGEIFSSSSR